MKTLKQILTVLLFSFLASVGLNFAYYYGYVQGNNTAVSEAQSEIDSLVSQFQNKQIAVKPLTSPTSAPLQTTAPAPKRVAWGGPELWTAVNTRRVQLGVNELSQRDELCTLASIRLNELLALGRLDGHEGFSTMPDRRPDIKYLYEKYTLTEFLIQGASSAQDAVNLWENTLGHKKLLTGGEYVWGCIYAQNTFGVAITAY